MCFSNIRILQLYPCTALKHPKTQPCLAQSSFLPHLILALSAFTNSSMAEILFHSPSWLMHSPADVLSSSCAHFSAAALALVRDADA